MAPSPTPYDCVFCVNAFHWVDPEVRYAKASAVVREGGVLAVATSSYVVPEDADPFWTEVQDDYEAVGAGRLDPADVRPRSVRGYRDEMTASGFFDVLAVTRYLWQLPFSAIRYRELLETSSWHKTLPEPARSDLLDRIQRRVEAQADGTITATLAATLTIGRRKPASAA